jgi:hypothetical protein
MLVFKQLFTFFKVRCSITELNISFIIKNIFNVFVSLSVENLELSLDAHSIDISDLCQRFNTNIETGMTSEAIEVNRCHSHQPFFTLSRLFGQNKLECLTLTSPLILGMFVG